MPSTNYVKKLYGNIKAAPCPFTEQETGELGNTKELLVYLPANLSMVELCKMWGVKTNVDFENEKLIHNVMAKEDQWFIASSGKAPELLYKSANYSKQIYESEGLHGMDFRRYLAFAATFKRKFGFYPDQSYWVFLLSGSYDKSGVSIVGFDSNGALSHHGWMKNFKSKFCGSCYVVLAPRIEITPETEKLSRAYRGKGENFIAGKEAAID